MAKYKIDEVVDLEPIIIEFNGKEYKLAEPTNEIIAKADGYAQDAQIGRDAYGTCKALAIYMGIEIFDDKEKGKFTEEFEKLTKMPISKILGAAEFLQQCIMNPEKYRDPMNEPKPKKGGNLSK